MLSVFWKAVSPEAEIVFEQTVTEVCAECGTPDAQVHYVCVDTGQGEWVFSRAVCHNTHCRHYDARVWVPTGVSPREGR